MASFMASINHLLGTWIVAEGRS